MADISKIAAATQDEAALHDTAALRNALQESPDFAIIVTDEMGIVQTFNAGAERMLGYAAAEAVNRLSPSDFQDPREAQAHAKALSAELGTTVTPGFGALTAKASRGLQDKHELTYVRKDGGRFTALVAITALHDERDRITGYLLIGTQISATTRDEEAAAARLLRAEVEHCHEELKLDLWERTVGFWDREQLFRQLATSIPEALWIRDAGSKTLRYINPAWEKITGRAVAAGDDMTRLYEAFHAEDLPRVLDAVRVFPNGGVSLECRIVMPGGIERWVHICTFAITDSDGKICRVAGFLEDITARKEESERVERLKDDFVSMVSHELRTPLTSIAGSLGLLAGEAAGSLPKSAARLIKIAHSNSQRLIRLVGDILDIERLESGKLAFDLERVEVRSLVRHSIEAIRGFAQSYGVRIRLDGSSVTGEVCADSDRLIQVFTNLLSNAVKFSPAGAEVVVTIEKSRDRIRISVRDHGCGIPEAFKPRIFEKFAQADTGDSRKLGGAGLGLSIVHQIVTRLDGKVGFEDAPGGGTIFHIELPDWDHLDKTRSEGARILLCEDDPEIAAALCEHLWQAGFMTDVADTASEAVERAESTTYSAILVDLHAPEDNGIDLIQQLRAQRRSYNTLLVVAPADLDQIPENSKSSAIQNILNWLGKPIETNRLVRLVDRPAGSDTSERPRILHVDDDRDMIHLVTQALDSSAEVMSVASLDEARRALATNRFDIAVLNVALASGSGLDLLSELRDLDSGAIPLVMFSAPNADTDSTTETGLIRSHTPVHELIATLRRQLTGGETTGGGAA